MYAEDCKRNFDRLGRLFSPQVCNECQGCVMSQIYAETGGEHPSTVRLMARTERAMASFAQLSGEPGQEEPGL